jgi:hypothetical protein
MVGYVLGGDMGGVLSGWGPARASLLGCHLRGKEGEALLGRQVGSDLHPPVPFYCVRQDPGSQNLTSPAHILPARPRAPLRGDIVWCLQNHANK